MMDQAEEIIKVLNKKNPGGKERAMDGTGR